MRPGHLLNDRQLPQQGIGALLVEKETRRVDPRHIRQLNVILSLLEAANEPAGVDAQGLGFHALTGDQAGRYAVKIDKNWRVTFGWSDDGPDAVDVDYEDYH